MTAPTPYLHLPGTAREALTSYAEVFGGRVVVHSFAEFGRADGPADAVAHGQLVDGPVALFAADVAGDEQPLRCAGLMFFLLGAPTRPPCAPGSAAWRPAGGSSRNFSDAPGEPPTARW